MRFIIGLVLGLVIGGGVAFYFLTGAPRAKQASLGAKPVQAPEAAGDPPGTLLLTFDEKFFDTLLGTIFRDLSPPAFRLGANRDGAGVGLDGLRFVNAQDGGCTNQVTIAQEGSGTRTAVSLQNGQINTPLAFSGSYAVLGSCQNFRGNADAQLALSFNQPEQTLYGQINVGSVNLEGVSPLVSPFVTGFVQSAINQKVNPLVIMRGQQLTLNVPVQASGGTLRAQAKDVRAEIKDGALRLHISYDVAGAKGATAPPQPPG